MHASEGNLVIGFDRVRLVSGNVFVPNLFDIDTDQITFVFLWTAVEGWNEPRIVCRGRRDVEM